MPGEKTYKLEQVSVRLKLMEEAPLYSTSQIDTPERAVEVMCGMMKSLDRESVCVVNLDGASHPINFNVVSIGSINMSPVGMSELFKTAILSNASNILMLHNHPSSSITPSREDHAVTARVMMASQMIGIPLVDHIIVGGGTGEYFSYKNELKGMFNIEGMQTLLRANGIKGVFAEPVVEYGSGKEGIPDLGPKRVEEKRENNGNPVGKLFFYLSGEVMYYYTKDDYLRALKEELDTNPQGFKHETLTDDPEIRKSADDLIYGLFGMKNPYGIDFYLARHSEEADKTDKTNIVADFRAETERHFKEICGMNAGDIEVFVKAEAQRIFDDYEMPVEIVDAVVCGSRSRGLEKDDSDLDVVLEYKGEEPEDAVFGALNEEKLVIGDVRVDINPITS